MAKEERDHFLKEMGISQEDFERSGLKWSMLKAIRADYNKKVVGLEKVALRYVEELSKIEGVHSVRFRIKEVTHVLEKIIRKALEGDHFTKQNYMNLLPDIVGIRVLYVFKSDWKLLHDQISENYRSKFSQKPEFQLKDGDDKSPYEKIKGIEVIEKKDYRSNHYVIRHDEYDNTGERLFQVLVEIQTRSIFEEGWSEMNHMLVYKKKLPEEIKSHMVNISTILSGLAGECDRLGDELRGISGMVEQGDRSVGESAHFNRGSEGGGATGKEIVDLMEQCLVH